MSTYKEYIKFCQSLQDAAVQVYSVEKAVACKDDLSKQFVVLKHDVEAKLEKAVRISEIESRYGIKSTYYVHAFFLQNPKNIIMLKQIADLGHEIGYHYDVLDANDGDREKAVKEFTEAISRFADNGFVIKTVCPHGNPLKKRVGYSSNKDFFLDPSIREAFSNIVDVYITFPELVANKYLYITDAKYSYFYRDAQTTKTDATEELIPLNGQDEIISRIKDGNSMVISTHTHRYFSFVLFERIRIYLYKIIKIVSRILYKTSMGKRVINKFYYLAKKI